MRCVNQRSLCASLGSGAPIVNPSNIGPSETRSVPHAVSIFAGAVTWLPDFEPSSPGFEREQPQPSTASTITPIRRIATPYTSCGRLAAMTAVQLEAAVVRAQAGDGDALETVIAAVEDRVYGLAVRMLGVPADAEDAAQE